MFDKNRQKVIGALPAGTYGVWESGTPRPRIGDQFYPFTPERDFYYLTGLTDPNLKLLLTCEGEARLFVERPDPIRVKWVGAPLTKGEARILSGITRVEYLDEFPESLPGRRLEKEQQRQKIGRAHV